MDSAPYAYILVVDDEAANMRALCETLQSHGYRTFGVTNGAEALTALQREQFDLLLTDLMMPGMDGVQLLASALKVDPHLVGVLMTGQGTIETAVAAMKAGALDYVLKPIRLSAILPVLSRATGVRRLRQENAALQEGLRQRTADLEAANRDLESFSLSVSHDLRAPLARLEGFARLLEEDHGPALNAEGRRIIDVICQNTRRMDNLIEDLLTYSRLGRQPLRARKIDMSAVVADAVKEVLGDLAQPVPINVGPLPSVEGDPSLLKQVWINLLSNAVKFTGKVDAPAIEVSCAPEEGEHVFRVRDNGAGFDMQYYDKVFGVFQRLHPENQFPGTGVGLAIVQRLVAKHGGRVWAEGKVGEGATFYFTLPQRTGQLRA